MSRLRCVQSDVEKYLPNYYLAADRFDDDAGSYQYLALVGCILVIGLTLFMGTRTWSGDRETRQMVQPTSIAVQYTDAVYSR